MFHFIPFRDFFVFLQKSYYFCTMQNDNYDSSASGCITDSFEGISREFTNVEILSTSEVNVVARGKRYGRWWLLKGLRNGEAEVQRQRLRKELEILTELQHPNIVTAVGLEAVEGIGSCIVMEYVDGVTLKEWLTGPTTRQKRRSVLRDLLLTIGYVHRKGIVHRDIKPENIIITNNGENVKLIDFGLADSDSYAVLKQPAGTERYMSPEQKETSVADVRNDIYSIGIIMQQMNLGSRYDSIINRCTSPIDKRWGSVGELLQGIDRHRIRRNLAWASGGLTVVILLTVLAVWETGNDTEAALAAETVTPDMTSRPQQQETPQDTLVVTQEHPVEQMPLQDTKKGKLAEAIKNGYQYVDNEIADTKINEHLDTLTSLLYLRKDFGEVFAKSDTWCEHYLQTLGTNFTPSEKAEIRKVVIGYIAKSKEKWIQQFNKQKEAYDSEFMQGY